MPFTSHYEDAYSVACLAVARAVRRALGLSAGRAGGTAVWPAAPPPQSWHVRAQQGGSEAWQIAERARPNQRLLATWACCPAIRAACAARPAVCWQAHARRGGEARKALLATPNCILLLNWRPGTSSTPVDNVHNNRQHGRSLYPFRRRLLRETERWGFEKVSCTPLAACPYEMEDSPKYTKKWPKSTRPTSWAAKGEAPEQDHQARGLCQHPKLCELSKGCQNLLWASLVNSQIPWSPNDVFWRVQENTKHQRTAIQGGVCRRLGDQHFKDTFTIAICNGLWIAAPKAPCPSPPKSAPTPVITVQHPGVSGLQLCICCALTLKDQGSDFTLLNLLEH